MPPKKNRRKSASNETTVRTLRSRTVGMAISINQIELAALIRKVLREEREAELPAVRATIREELNASLETIQPQLRAVEESITKCNGQLAEVDEASSKIEGRVTLLELSNASLKEENAKLKDKIERLEKQVENSMCV